MPPAVPGCRKEGSARPSPFCQALAWIPFRGRLYPLLPRLSVRYCLAGVLLCVAALLVLEGVVRVAGRRYHLLATPEWKEENRVINENVKLKLLGDRGDLLWRSAGVDPPLQKRRAKRILVVGDSYVWGDGYANVNDTWWRQLARELERRGYEDVEVIAAGYCGASTRDQLRMLTDGDLVHRYQVDAVVMGFVTNDPDEGILGEVTGEAEGPPAFLSALSALAPAIASLAEDRWAAKRAKLQGRSYGDWEGALYEGRNWDLYRSTVAALAAYREEAGIPFFVLALPNYPNAAYFRPKLDKAGLLYREQGIPFYDCFDALLRQYPERAPGRRWKKSSLELGINPANGHPGPASTRAYARVAADILEKQYPQVLGPRNPNPSPPAPEINDWLPATLKVERTGDHRWTFEYPRDDREMPSLPLGRKHVLLCLESPVPLRSVRLSAPGLAWAGLCLTCADSPHGADEGKLYDLGTRRGRDLEWDLSGARLAGPVNTLRIWGEAGDGPLTLDLVPWDGPEAR